MKAPWLFVFASMSVGFVGCASAPNVAFDKPIVIYAANAVNTARVQDDRVESIRKGRQDEVDGHSAAWLGDVDFSPILPVAIAGALDRAFVSYPKANLKLRAVHVGVYRWSDRTPRAAADPIIFLGGASIAANLIGNAAGQMIADRLLSREVVSKEYWAVVLAVEVDGRTVAASNRRIREPTDSAQSVLPQLLQFTADDILLKYRLQKSKP